MISNAIARSIYDSRGRPTIEVDIITTNAIGRGMAPAGASTGAFEAVELRDEDGLGVQTAIGGFNAEVRPLLIGLDCREQELIDKKLCVLDQTGNKSRLGGNTLIASSLAVINAAAAASNQTLWRYLAQSEDLLMPLPEIQIIGGGAHANNRINLQDIMAIPVGAPDWTTALDWCARVYRSVGKIMDAENRIQGVADEGGFWPDVSCNEDTFSILTRGIEGAGLKPGEQVAISIDVAANQFYHNGNYLIGSEKECLNSQQWVERLLDWTNRFPILMVEDPCAETDIAGYSTFCEKFRDRGLVIGDDLVVTQADMIEKANDQGAISGALIKPNQVGTVTEAREALMKCRSLDLVTVLSARSGETEDPSVMDLSVGLATDMVKVGSITRGERTAKWNQGIRIAESLTRRGELVAATRFPWGKGLTDTSV